MEAFWHRMAFEAPELAKTALFYLSIHPSEAASERGFSAQGTVHWKRRARLLEDSVRALMVVRSNYHLLRPLGRRAGGAHEGARPRSGGANSDSSASSGSEEGGESGREAVRT